MTIKVSPIPPPVADLQAIYLIKWGLIRTRQWIDLPGSIGKKTYFGESIAGYFGKTAKEGLLVIVSPRPPSKMVALKGVGG